MMPDMTGFQVLEELNSGSATCQIPATKHLETWEYDDLSADKVVQSRTELVSG
ncbi:hypothetical protein [Microcoleus sp. F4-D5]|uniref:hypothetical protein n=1 Tax=Microcoleus sp. F4-D5 TaxID=2818760 RepID=UPI002FD243F6